MGKETLRAACLLQVLFLPLFLAAERQQTGSASGMRCLNSYGIQHRRVDCTWRRDQTLGEGAFYLNFSDPYRSARDPLVCRLSPSSEAWEEFSCSAEGRGQFVENDEYTVSLHYASLGEKVASVAWEETYEPMRNIKCDPPYDIWSNMSGSRCLIAWKMPKAYVLIWEAMQWQLQFRATRVPWEQAETKTVVSRETWMEIDRSELAPGTGHAARVRCKTPDDSDAYASQWSEWSAPAEWSVPPGPSRLEESLVLLATFISILGALLLLLLLPGFYSRIKSCCSTSTPSPAAFFLPLYTLHKGDFQAWIGVKERDVWLRGGTSTDSGMHAGPGTVTLRPLEAVSQLSSFRRLSGGELPSVEHPCHLPSAPGQHDDDEASNYVVVQEEAKAPMLPGRGPLPLAAPNAAGEGFPYWPYKNALFAEQEPQEAEMLSSSGRASWPLGTSPRSLVPM